MELFPYSGDCTSESGSPSSSVQGDAILEGAAWEFAAGANQRGSLVSRQRFSTEEGGEPFLSQIYPFRPSLQSQV
jgi:hypothetical protein